MNTAPAQKTYEATASREGKWWTFQIPELTSPAPSGGVVIATGQARTLADLDQAAREVAALWLEIEEDQVQVNVSVTAPAAAAALWSTSAQREEDGRAALKESADLKREAVQALKAQGISQRDMARLLGVSTQRVNQLAHP